METNRDVYPVFSPGERVVLGDKCIKSQGKRAILVCSGNMEVTAKTVVEASVKEVFAVVSDIATRPDHMEGVTEVEVLTPGNVGVGTRWKETRRLHGTTETEEMMIVEFVKDSYFTSSAENHGVSYKTVYRVELVEGGCKLSMTFGGESQTLFAKVLMFLTAWMSSSLQAICQKDLEDIKKFVERRKDNNI